MKRKLLLLLPILLILLMGKNARAQCEVHFWHNKAISPQYYGMSFGQSFTAECNGYITAVEIYMDDTIYMKSDTLKIYEGLPSDVYPTIRLPFDSIYLPGVDSVPLLFNIYDTMPVSNGNEYAFDLFIHGVPDPGYPYKMLNAGLYHTSIGNRYTGGSYLQDGMLGGDGDSDLCFKVTISNEPPKSYCELSCIENQHRVFDEDQEYYTVVGDEFDPKDSCMGYAETASLVNNINDAATLAGAQITNNTEITWTLTDSFGNTSECSFMVNVTNDINERLWASASVYPVPAGNKLVVSFDIPHKLQSQQLSVFDITGRLIVTPPVTMRTDALEIDVHSLQTGVYILQVADASGNKALRFIKK